MYIAPGSTIRLLTNVPLDASYNHSLSFTSKTAQTAYFTGKAKHILSNQSYQRNRPGVFRANLSADACYDCNYIMYQNSNFGSKWFYGFITAVDYVSNDVCDINFTLDPLMTWYFDYTLKPCFIERTHVPVSEDTIGNHIEPEPVALGEYVQQGYGPLAPGFNELCVIVAVVDVTSGADVQLQDRVVSGATLKAFNRTNLSAIESLLDSYNTAPDSIISMYMCPVDFINNGNIPDGGATLTNSLITSFIQVSKPKPQITHTLDGYIPKNAKMYTYPYCFYRVGNSSGNGLDLRFEFFDGDDMSGRIVGTVTEPVQATFYPTHYKGSESNTAGTFAYGAETITLQNYPMCSWNGDAYKAWVAQNSLPLDGFTVTPQAKGYLGAVGALASGSPAGVVDAATRAMGVLQEEYTHSIAADISKGNFNNGGPNINANMNQFFGGRVTVTKQFARMIDNFFDMFGYAIKKIGTPDRAVRPVWTYIKTAGCVAVGSVPRDDMEKICQIYDSGCTFWTNGDNVGNYNLNNRG